MSFNLREEIKDEFMSPNCSRKVYFGDLLRSGARKVGGPVTFNPNMFFKIETRVYGLSNANLIKKKISSLFFKKKIQ
jgi:hypothetical protein